MRDFQLTKDPLLGTALVFGVMILIVVLAIPLTIATLIWVMFVLEAQKATPLLVTSCYIASTAVVAGILLSAWYALTSKERFTRVITLYGKLAIPTIFALAIGGIAFRAFPARMFLEMWPPAIVGQIPAPVIPFVMVAGLKTTTGITCFFAALVACIGIAKSIEIHLGFDTSQIYQETIKKLAFLLE